MIKYSILILIVIIFYLLAPFFVHKKWLPDYLQNFLLVTKYQAGDCLRANKIWGVNPKIIIGTKFKNGETFYLLKDEDRYEEYQLISKLVVESQAEKIQCRYQRTLD